MTQVYGGHVPGPKKQFDSTIRIRLTPELTLALKEELLARTTLHDRPDLSEVVRDILNQWRLSRPRSRPKR